MIHTAITHTQLKSVRVRKQYSGFTANTGFIPLHPWNHKYIQPPWSSGLYWQGCSYTEVTLNRGASHCCFLLQSCSLRAWLYLAYTAQLFKGIIPGSYNCTHKGAAVPRMKRVVKLVIGYPRFLQEKRSICVEAQAQGHIWQYRNTASFAMQAYQYRCSSTILVTALETALSCGPRCLFKFTPSFSSKKSIMNSVPDTFLWLYSIQGIFPWGESFPSK